MFSIEWVVALCFRRLMHNCTMYLIQKTQQISFKAVHRAGDYSWTATWRWQRTGRSKLLGWLHCLLSAAGNTLPHFALFEAFIRKEPIEMWQAWFNTLKNSCWICSSRDTNSWKRFSFLVIHRGAWYVWLPELEVVCPEVDTYHNAFQRALGWKWLSSGTKPLNSMTT